MGRERKVYERDNLHFFIISSIAKRLDNAAKVTGWSKTRIVEDALFSYLNKLEIDTKEGKS